MRLIILFMSVKYFLKLQIQIHIHFSLNPTRILTTSIFALLNSCGSFPTAKLQAACVLHATLCKARLPRTRLRRRREKVPSCNLHQIQLLSAKCLCLQHPIKSSLTNCRVTITVVMHGEKRRQK